jgi:hypothetical protein
MFPEPVLLVSPFLQAVLVLFSLVPVFEQQQVQVG